MAVRGRWSDDVLSVVIAAALLVYLGGLLGVGVLCLLWLADRA